MSIRAAKLFLVCSHRDTFYIVEKCCTRPECSAAAVEKKKLCSAATAEDCNTMPEYRILVVQYTVGA